MYVSLFIHISASPPASVIIGTFKSQSYNLVDIETENKQKACKQSVLLSEGCDMNTKTICSRTVSLAIFLLTEFKLLLCMHSMKTINYHVQANYKHSMGIKRISNGHKMRTDFKQNSIRLQTKMNKIIMIENKIKWAIPLIKQETGIFFSDTSC